MFTYGDNVEMLDEYAWYKDNSDQSTHPAGRKKANAWGVYDMHGNVHEWCEDNYSRNYKGAPVDGSPWHSDPNFIGTESDTVRVQLQKNSRIFRGGSWDNEMEYCRSASRLQHMPVLKHNHLGFRVVRELKK